MTREEAIREMLFAKREVIADSYIDRAYDVAIKALEQPEIIRCKDCKHWEGEKRGQFWYFEQCSLNHHIASCDDYCSYAERRE